MFSFLVRRLAGLIPLLLVVSAFVFVLGQYGAGDLAAYLTFQRSGGRFDQELYDRYRAELGLDDPVLVRYTTWLGKALQGDLGRSYVAIGEPEIAGLRDQEKDGKPRAPLVVREVRQGEPRRAQPEYAAEEQENRRRGIHAEAQPEHPLDQHG